MAWPFTIAIMLIRKTFQIKNCKWEYLILLYGIQRPTAPWKPGWNVPRCYRACHHHCGWSCTSTLPPPQITHNPSLFLPSGSKQLYKLGSAKQVCNLWQRNHMAILPPRGMHFEAVISNSINLRLQASNVSRQDGNICCYAQTQFISPLIILSPWKCLVTVQRCISV